MRNKNRTSAQPKQPAPLQPADGAGGFDHGKRSVAQRAFDAIALELARVEPPPAATPLIALPLHRALVTKYNAGRAGREHLPFQGDALLELYDEVLDGLNYCDQLDVEGRVPQFTATIRGLLLELEGKVRDAYGVDRQAALLARLENSGRR